MEGNLVAVGEVVKPQGIRGEIKVSAGDSCARLAGMDSVYLRLGAGEAQRRRVLSGRANGGFAYLLLEGVPDRNAAETLRGAEVLIPREAARLGQDENFISDLIGLAAVDTEGREVGRLRDVLRPNAVCDVYVFDTPRGEMMIPALKRVVTRVDLEAGRIVLDARALGEVALWQDAPGIEE